MVSLNPKRLQELASFKDGDQLQWRRKLLVFSFFLLLSVIIWLLNALSKNYTTEIEYPITYTNYPENKVLISDLPDHLGLQVNARGYSLLIYKLSNRPVPINFRVASFAMNRFPDDSTKFFLLTRYAREQIARQLPAELQLSELSPDTLIFQFANEITRKVMVRPRISFEPGREFTLVNRVRLQPDSVLVTGPDIYLDTLSAVPTRKLDLGVLEKGFTGDLKLSPGEFLRLQTDEVRCSIQIEKVTEFQVSVPVQVSGLPDSLRLQTFPQSVMVSGKVGLSKYERVVPEAFRAEVTYEDVLQDRTHLNVLLQMKPDFLTDIDYYPRSVEYLLTLR